MGILSRLRPVPGLIFVFLGLVLLAHLLWMFRNRARNLGAIAAAGAATAFLFLGYLLQFERVYRHFPVNWAAWLQCAGLVEVLGLAGLNLGLPVWRRAAQFSSTRRGFLQAAGAGLCLAPAAATAFGILQRDSFRVTETTVPLPNLPREFDGFRIVQITDIHLSPFLTAREFARAVDMANETRADLGLVTGDLITRLRDPLDACLRELARFRAGQGILGCLGNHEVYTETEDYVTAAGRRIGIEFLRGQSTVLRSGGAALNFAGVDYQPMHRPYLTGAERLQLPGMVNILLSHNPDVFPVAAAKGFDFTIAGHTHGGQVDVEILHRHMSVARYYTRFVRGLYRIGPSAMYVSCGLGTIVAPIRLGAPPEVSLLTLRAV